MKKKTPLMKKPEYTDPYYKTTLKDSKHNIWTGKEVFFRFFNQGVGKERYIPRELLDKNWEPDLSKKYEVWWDSTNPSDPADSGHNYIDYIEEIKDSSKKKESLKSMIIQVIKNLDENELLKVANYLNIKLC